MIKQLRSLLKSGNFHLTKFISNSKSFLETIPNENLASNVLNFTNRELPIHKVTIFSLPKRRTFFDNNCYQPYKLFCKTGKIFLDICWTLSALDNYILIISTNTEVYFLNLLCKSDSFFML